jgi:hypothetical protein
MLDRWARSLKDLLNSIGDYEHKTGLRKVNSLNDGPRRASPSASISAQLVTFPPSNPTPSSNPERYGRITEFRAGCMGYLHAGTAL